LYNDAVIYDDFAMARWMYNSPMFKPETRADKCEECGECLEKCPQHIQIQDYLKKADAALKLEPTPPKG
jgi:predicted aldo/keto reductase-like oxidoreductase